MNGAIQRSLWSAHVTSVLEPVGLNRGDGKRPDGLTVFPWKFGKVLVWDVTVGATVAATSQPEQPRMQQKTGSKVISKVKVKSWSCCASV